MTASEIFKIPKPENFSAEHAQWFHHESYRIPRLKVLKLRNTLCTYDGLCVRHGILVREGVHRYPRPLLEFALKALRVYVAACVTKRGQLSRLDENVDYLLIHHPWLNYYHWMLDYLPRLLLVEDRLPELTLILPQHYKEVAYVQDSLRAFSFSGISYLAANTSARVPHLTLPQLRPESKWYAPSELVSLQGRFADFLDEQREPSSQSGERIYISRRDANHRKITNEAEVTHLLESYGFATVSLSDLSLYQQMRLFQGARYVVAPHGAGLTNLLFMKQGGAVLELIRECQHRKDFFPHMYWFLSAHLGLRYLYQLCSPLPVDAPALMADLQVDIDKLDQHLNLLLQNG